MSSSDCCFLTCIQISQEASEVVWYSHLFQDFPQLIVIHTVKGFSIVNKAEIDVFLELSCFFDDPADVGNLISGSSAFSKTSLNIRKFTVTYCWTLAWRILSITLLECEMSAMCGCLNILWNCFSLGLEWKLTFSSPVATAEFSKFAGILSAEFSQHHLSGFEIRKQIYVVEFSWAKPHYQLLLIDSLPCVRLRYCIECISESGFTFACNEKNKLP